MPQWDCKQLKAAQLLCQLGLATVQTLCYFPLAEIVLFRAVMAHPTTDCLGVLLQSGCRSEWLPTLAAVEGRRAHYAAAVEAGCPIAGHALVAAAHHSNAEFLGGVCLGVKNAQYSGSLNLDLWDLERLHPINFTRILTGGQSECLETLLRAQPFLRLSRNELCERAMEVAARLGREEFLKAAHRCVPYPLTLAYMKGGVQSMAV